MFFAGSKARPRLVRCLAGTFTWLSVGPSVGAAYAARPPRPLAQQRLLTLRELGAVRGGQMQVTEPGGVAPVAPATEPNAGGTLPWEGSLGDLNTVNGNKLTRVPLVHWTARGGLPVSLVLYHNSAALVQSELGQHWTHSFAIYGAVDASTGDFTVQWGDNLEYTFVHNIDGSFSAPPGIYDTLTFDSATQSYTLTRRNQVRYTFRQPNGLRWNCTRITDRNQNALTIEHTASDFVSRVVDPTGRALTFTYSGTALVGVSDPLGQTFSFVQSGGDLTQVRFPAVGTQVPSLQFAYNAQHNITQLTDARGKVWTFGYTPDGRALAWETDPLQRTTSYTYEPGRTRQTDPLGNATTDFYQGGRLVRREDPTQAAVGYTYSQGALASQTDPEGNTTQLVYDSRGNLVSVTDPLGNVTTTLYNAKNDPVLRTSPAGNALSYSYDAAGNLVQRTNPLQETTQFAVNGFGLLVSATDPLGRQTQFRYDPHGNESAITDALGRTHAWTYDLLGRPTSESQAGQTTTIAYNNQGRVSQVTAPGSRTTAFAYDLAGNTTAKTNALGQSEQWVYDAAGQLLRHTDALGRTTAIGYDAGGNRVRLTDGRGKTTQYAYDPRHLLSGIAYPDGTSQQFAYGARGQLTSRVDGRGVQAGFTYDAGGNLTAIHYSDATPDVAFAYNSEGRTVQMTDGSGLSSYAYDAAGRLTQRTTPQGAVHFTYDAAGQLQQRTAGSAPTDFVYDAAGQLIRTVDGGTLTTDFDYDALGRLVTTQLPNGALEARTYSAAGDLLGVQSTRAGAVLTRQDYTYDALGRKTAETTPEASVTYSYDAAGQLVQEQRTGTSPYHLQYTYDAAGNRVSRTVNGTVESYTYDNANKLLSAGSKLYSYDAAGNVTGITLGGVTLSLSWDGESRLTGLQQGGSRVAYHYNGHGQRVGKSGDTSASYLLADDTIDSPVLSDGSTRYTHGPAGLLTARRAGAAQVFHTDGLGSVRGQSDATGTLTRTCSTDAFGAPVASTGANATPFGFAGSAGYQEDAESGLMRVGHRLYDASTGRFLSRDPIQAGSNWYVYCDNDPLNALDPEGLDKVVVTWTGRHQDKSAPRFIYDGRMDCYDDDGRLIWTMPVDSGGHGNGMLPPGNFKIEEPPRKSGNPTATGGTFTPLDPTFPTDRTDLGIHYDGGLPGTQGCIGITSEEDYQRWLDYMRQLGVSKKNPLPVVSKPLPKKLPPDKKKKPS